MNDRELLGMAAKAYGRKIVGWNDQHEVHVAVLDDGSFWQPLWENAITDSMGDALRLAVKLRLTVSWDRFDDSDYATATPPYSYQGQCYDCVVDGCQFEAARRAIVRAAAEIGKSIP